ncbi:unnamed protein product [Cylindrotheca closterium]|uniref:EF-hand domain-containing protein n=1 Tax=Cylindrotheca closterium TaxID=2856 RepID=A0AAD2FLS6_9STRA|nr:unnamed protein product [Cylindrotheca closterium]CAJ1942674.1 unnamed protein product [Cylindrotheca closterium]
MKIQMQTSTLSFLLLAASSQAFAPSSGTFRSQRIDVDRPSFVAPTSSSVLFASSNSTLPDPSDAQVLRAKAQQLRDEASELATEQAQKVSDAAMKVFAKFDTNKDGTISAEELKMGLEKTTKTSISKDTAEKLLQQLDTNGDGVLQKEEFQPVDRLKNQLDFILRGEKALVLNQGKLAKQIDFEKNLRAKIISLINDGEPTGKDKVVSVLPYIFPLLDSLAYAAPWIVSHQDNPIAHAAAVAFTFYRSIPLSGFLAFFALSYLSTDLSLNRLVRFNLQQAIILDVALFVPGLMIGLVGLVGSGLGAPVPGVASEYLSDAVALGTLATIAYASAASLTGNTPDQVPLLSNYVKNRMITKDMFDKKGRFVGPGVEDKDVNNKN